MAQVKIPSRRALEEGFSSILTIWMSSRSLTGRLRIAKDSFTSLSRCCASRLRTMQPLLRITPLRSYWASSEGYEEEFEPGSGC